MIGSCCGTRLQTIYDGCVKVVKRCPRCKRRIEQRKRRPAGLDTATCTWRVADVYCDDHPTDRHTR